MQPVSFEGHAGALHRASAEPASVAVVICPSIGRDGTCAYRTFFDWADALAAKGFPTLRYDALGEGDSLSLDPNADQLSDWIDGVVRAAAFVRAHTGAREVVLAGLRMGGALALAAATRAEAAGLILLAPVMTGAAWLRDLRFSAAIQKLEPSVDGGLDIEGLRLLPSTVQSLETFEAAPAQPTWRKAFLAATGSGKGVAEKLGPEVTTVRFEGYSLLFKEAFMNTSPDKVLGEAADWLAAFAADAPAPARAAPLPLARLEGAGWVEHPVTLAGGYRGMLCEPKRGGSGRAVLLGNTAADPRSGVGNFSAKISRGMASRGVATLRMDFLGIGESPEPRAVGGDIFAKSRLPEYRAGASLLRDEGYSDLTLLGVCTGGYHAIRAVVESREFKRAIAFNTWLVFRSERSLELRSETADPNRKASKDPGASALTKILRGEINIREALDRKARQVWASMWPEERCRNVRREIRAAGRAGADMHLVMGRGDIALRGLEFDFGLNCAWLRRQKGVAVSIVPRMDHALFSEESQQNAEREIFRILDLKAVPENVAEVRSEPAERRAPQLAGQAQEA